MTSRALLWAFCRTDDVAGCKSVNSGDGMVGTYRPRFLPCFRMF